jgi:hypothetical protein
MKPPIGIAPQWFWIESLEVIPPSLVEINNRKLALEAACKRYADFGISPKKEWVIELSILNK